MAEKKKACISAGFLALGSPVDHFDSSFGPVTVAMFLLSGCFFLVCPVSVLVKLVELGGFEPPDRAALPIEL